MEKDEFLKGRYEETIYVDLKNGYVRQLEESELDETKGEKQWRVPHHAIINPHKPEKVRHVCDAAAKYKGKSLNGKLSTGADLLRNLIGLIFRFQEHQIALLADIDAMFLRVKLPPQEYRGLQFLWRSKPEDKIGVYKNTRHVFGAKAVRRVLIALFSKQVWTTKIVHP